MEAYSVAMYFAPSFAFHAGSLIFEVKIKLIMDHHLRDVFICLLQLNFILI